jgi:hypothetical protein
LTSTPHWKRLHRIAAELEPDELPYYAASADHRHRAVGWYFRPLGVAHAVYLGHNHIVAELALLERLQRIPA